MKLKNVMTLALAAFACTPLAEAQDAAFKAIVLLPGEKGPQEVTIASVDGKGGFQYVKRGTAERYQMNTSACGMFFIPTPAPLAEAWSDYRSGDNAAARKGFAAVKKAYAPYAALPNSPAMQAAMGELCCAVRMQDWKAVKALSASFPVPANMLLPADQVRLKAASIIGGIADGAKSEAQKKAVTELMKQKGVLKQTDAETYGWLRYAVADACAAEIPADQLQGTIAADKLKLANEAIDNFCQCVMSSHSATRPLPENALNRAIGLMWALPGVKEYAASAPTPMTGPAWASAPANFKDAVALANYLKVLYPAQKGSAPNELADKLAAFYYNARQGSSKNKKK